MTTRFDRWIQATLQPRDGESPPPAVDVAALVAQARRRRKRARLRAGLSVSAVALASALFLAVTPEKIGSRSGRYEDFRVMRDGRTMIKDGFTDEGTIVGTREEAEEWNQIIDRAAAGEEKIVGAAFMRYNGHTKFDVLREQVDPKVGHTISYSKSAASPADDLTLKDVRKILSIVDSAAYAKAEAGDTGIPLPDERHQVDGTWYRFRVWAVDFPEVGRVIFGRSVVEVR